MVSSKSISNGIVRAVITLALLTLLLFFLYKIKDVIVYVLISLVISLIAAPVINFLKKRLKFSNTLAVATTLILFFTLFVGLFLLFIPLINSQSDNLALLDTNNLKNQITNVYSKILVYLQNYNIKINKSDITSKIDFGFISNFFNSLLGFIGNLGITVATTFFISFFFLKDKILFSKIINKVIPASHEEKFFNSFDKIKILLSRYFIGLIAQLSVVFVLYLAVLLIFGIENAFVIAFLCAL